MAEQRKAIPEMTDDDLEGFDLKDIHCRSCSGYGNCGFKTYGILHGKVVSICNRRKAELKEQRAAAQAGESEVNA